MKASSILPTLTLLVLPVFGKSLDYQETVIFFFLLLASAASYLSNSPKRSLSPRFLQIQILLILVLGLSSIHSVNPGISYYAFFYFLCLLLLLNLSLLTLNLGDFFNSLIIATLIYSLIYLLDYLSLVHLPLRPLMDNFLHRVWGHSNFSELLLISGTVALLKKQYYIFILFFLLLFSTHSRSAILSFLAVIPFLHLSRPFKLSLLLSSLIPLFLLFAGSPKYKSFDGNRLAYYHQALEAFVDSPFLGQGPGNFFIFASTTSAHSSILDYLSQNGIVFTIVFFVFIFYCLLNLYQTKSSAFLPALAAILYSLVDTSWTTYGIFAISLFFIFQNQTVHRNSGHSYLKILTFVVFLFAVSKTASDLLYLGRHYQASLYIDPFNLNSRLALLPRYSASTLALFPNEPLVYQKLGPTNQSLYFTAVNLFPANPATSIAILQKLAQGNPQEGHFHVDLANALWHHGQQDQAVHQLLQICPKYPDAAAQCREYLSVHQSTPFDQPGSPEFIDYIKGLTPGLNLNNIKL